MPNRGVSINQMHTFKIRFKMKCTSDDGMIRSLSYHGSCMCHHVQLFPWLPDFCLAWYGHMSLRFCWIFDGLCVSEKVFLHLQTVSYRMTVVVFFFLNPFLNPFPNHFYRGQRLALRLKLCRSNVLCLYRLKDIGCC